MESDKHHFVGFGSRLYEVDGSAEVLNVAGSDLFLIYKVFISLLRCFSASNWRLCQLLSWSSCFRLWQHWLQSASTWPDLRQRLQIHQFKLQLLLLEGYETLLLNVSFAVGGVTPNAQDIRWAILAIHVTATKIWGDLLNLWVKMRCRKKFSRCRKIGTSRAQWRQYARMDFLLNCIYMCVHVSKFI